MGKILNRDMFPTEKDAEIAKLKCTITNYKAYDNLRSKQYKELLKENKWYKEENKELTDKVKLLETELTNIKIALRENHDESGKESL